MREELFVSGLVKALSISAVPMRQSASSLRVLKPST
jgi:hypothetical protein